MKFEFHNFLNKVSNYPEDNDHFLGEASWGMALALNERFTQMDLSPSIVINESLSPPVHVRIKDRLYGYYGEQSTNSLNGNYDVVASGDLLGHSERHGISLEALDYTRGKATQLIDEATQKAVAELSRIGILKAPHDSLEGSLLRAHMQGFDIDNILYHETEAENVRSILEEGFALNKVGSRGGDEQVPDGVFLKSNSHLINVATNPVQMAFLVRKEKQKTFESRKDLGDFLLEDPMYSSLSADCDLVNELYQEIVDDFNKALDKEPRRSEKRREIRDNIRSTIEDWKVDCDKAAAKARGRATEIFKESGFDTVSIKNDLGSFNRLVETAIILNPENVKSIQHGFLPTLSMDQSIRLEISLSL